MGRQVRAAVVSLVAFTILTGIAYPLAVTGLAQLAFPAQANSSLLVKGRRRVGSVLIGQPFDAAAGGAAHRGGPVRSVG